MVRIRIIIKILYMLLCLSVKPSKLHAILIQTQENDRYGMKGINTYQRSPKLEFLRGMDGRFMTSKPLVTARLHTLPIVPLSKPCVVSTKTSPIPRDDEQSNKDYESNMEIKVERFTMSQSWPVTCSTSKSLRRNIAGNI